MVATLYESADQFLFGADNEEEEYNMDFGEDQDKLLQYYWDDEDLEHAPTVSEEELSRLDAEAFLKEVTRLQDMNVLRREKEANLTEDYMELSTTAVYDWRHRDKTWQRRSRLVAREYKWSDPTRQDLFSSARQQVRYDC